MTTGLSPVMTNHRFCSRRAPLFAKRSVKLFHIPPQASPSPSRCPLYPQLADMCGATGDVCFGPKADICIHASNFLRFVVESNGRCRSLGEEQRLEQPAAESARVQWGLHDARLVASRRRQNCGAIGRVASWCRHKPSFKRCRTDSKVS